MKKLLITGSKGQLGSEINKIQSQFPQFQFIFNDIDDLDIIDFKSLKKYLISNPVDYLVNCAAYTAVDKAESEPEIARLVNTIGPQNLAVLSFEMGFRLIHISTDFVFDGNSKRPYLEDDIPNPLSVYGKSKLEGEKLVWENTKDYVIIRTSWLYSAFGNNFVKTMMRYGRERGLLKVVNDQFGSPTWAADLAGVILKIVKYSEENGFNPGIYHYSNEGAISWFDFAKEIINKAKINCEVIPIPTTAYPTPATRPSYSIMDKNKVKKTYELYIPFWMDSLASCLKEINALS
jgi:dTDP-4-dehydrorhamnose reductase